MDKAKAFCTMERCIADLRKWIYQDQLKVDDDKTQFLIIGSRQQLLKINCCTVCVGTMDIKPVSDMCNLGSWLASNFSISTHTSKSCSAAFLWFHNITRMSKFLVKDK